MTGFRAPGPRRWSRWLTTPLSVLLIVATVVAGSELKKLVPDYDDGSRPYVHTGRIGDAVDGLTFSVVVESVRGAAIVTARFGDEYRTDGVFVAVRAKVTAYSEVVVLRQVSVVDRSGRRFDSAKRFTQYMGELDRYQPGIPVVGEIVFEIPRDAGPGLVLQMSDDPNLDLRNQTIAQVDLGVDQSSVNTWLSTKEPLEVTTPEVAA